MVLKLYHYFRHTVQLHLKEVIYLSKEIHNFFYQDCLHPTIISNYLLSLIITRNI